MTFLLILLTLTTAKATADPEAVQKAYELKLKQLLSEIKDIRDIPGLGPHTQAGSLAIAFPDQLHPTQDGIGDAELDEFKIPMIEDMVHQGLDKNESPLQKFSQDYLKALIEHMSVCPAIIHAPLEKDPRRGQEGFETLAYVTDKTHTSAAQSDVYKKYLGKEGLEGFVYDKDGRPMNFVLVYVMEDWTKKTDEEFTRDMTEQGHFYPKRFSKGKKGKTIVSRIRFSDLPAYVYKMPNNPFRGIIGVIQHLFPDVLGKAGGDFSQFEVAEKLVEEDVVGWNEISKKASESSFKQGLKKVLRFLKSGKAQGLPGVPDKSCAAAFAL